MRLARPRLPHRNTLIVTGTTIAVNLVRIVSTITLTRILAPEAFGTIGVIASIAYVVQMMSDLGLQGFVIRHRQGAEQRFLDAIWTIRLARSLVLALIVFLSSGEIANLLNKPDLQPLIATWSVVFVLEGLSSLAPITAIRSGQVGRLGGVEVAEAVAQLALAIPLSLYFRSAWGIIVAMLISRGLRMIMTYAFFDNARRRLLWDRAYFRELLQFSSFVVRSSILTMLILQSDKILLSRFLPLDIFGLYMIAVSLASAPAAFVGAYIPRVLYPLYAATQREEPERLPAVFQSGGQKIRLLYMFALGCFVGLAPTIISILYDPRYAGAAPFLAFLALAPLLAFTTTAANEILVAKGRIDLTLHINISRLVWVVVMGTLGFLTFGAIGVAAAIGTVEVPALLHGYVALHRAGLLRAGPELAALALALAGIAAGLLLNRGYLLLFNVG